jgi:hypothetical protein
MREVSPPSMLAEMTVSSFSMVSTLISGTISARKVPSAMRATKITKTARIA